MTLSQASSSSDSHTRMSGAAPRAGPCSKRAGFRTQPLCALPQQLAGIPGTLQQSAAVHVCWVQRARSAQFIPTRRLLRPCAAFMCGAPKALVLPRSSAVISHPSAQCCSACQQVRYPSSPLLLQTAYARALPLKPYKP